MTAIKAQPTDGLCYSPSEELYWSAEGLAKEVERVFDICHGCRLCFNLCPSFPTLFDAVDREGGDVRKLTTADNDAVVDGCFQCKLCYVKCPYTPDDGHEFKLDFPRLMLRYTAQQTKRRGLSARDRFLGNPVGLGKAASRAAPVVNRMNRAKSHRVLMEKTLGIHRDKLLPEFASEPFEKWFARRDGTAATRTPPTQEAVLFHTCYVNYNAPEIGKDAVEVLERSGVRVLSPVQTCCGMPALDGGDIAFARKQARRNVETLAPYVEKGLPVLVVNPTCSYMLKKEIVGLVGKDMAAPAAKLAAATRDLGEYLFELKRTGKLDTSFKSSPGAIAYHVPCHLKAQNIGFRSRDALKAIPGVSVRLVDRCCGHDGTWAMKREHFEESMKIGKPAFDEMTEGGEMATDCPLAAVQFEQATGRRPLHPVQILARAYRENGFEPLPSRVRGRVVIPVAPAEIKTLGDYELARDAFRKRVLEVKSARRVEVGGHLTFLFENHDTVLYQIQEMLRVERITEPTAIAHEIRTYNDLISGPDELVATLLVEYEEPGERARMLRELVGLERHVSLVIAGQPPAVAVFDAAQIAVEKISSVHYVRFPLGNERASALGRGAGAEIVVDHPRIRARTALTTAQLEALRADLAS